MRTTVIGIMLLGNILLLVSCGYPAGREKLRYNSPESQEIHIGVAYPVGQRDEDTYFYKGLELAIESINKDGGILGKKLSMIVRDDKNDTNLAMQIAQTFYEQGITAVVGHWSTNVCYFVEDIYENNKMVMLTPDATGLNLFEDKYRYIYRMIGNNQVFSEAVASYMAEAGFKQVAIYFSDDEYGQNFAEILEQELVKHKIKVTDRVTSITSANADTVLQRWRAFGCDGIFMASTFPDYLEPIRLIREAGFDIPIFGADNFERTNFAGRLECSMEGIYLASLRREDLDSGFLNDFRGRYGHDPDIHAVSGYECVYLLKDAMEASGTIDSAAISEWLSKLEGYETVSGIRSYNPDTQEFDGYQTFVRTLD